MDSGDAQKQIQALRAELYSTRKQQREAQQHRDLLAEQVQQQQLELQQLRQQARQSGDLHKALQQASVRLQSAELEVKQLKSALAAATAECQAERTNVKKATEAQERAEADRQRLQRARDELARNLLGLERRAQEAEEEQSRIQQESQAEIRTLQAKLSEGRDEFQAGQAAGNVGSSDEHESLRQEVELERQRAAVLVAALNSAKRERDAAQQQLEILRRSSDASTPAGPPAGDAAAPAHGTEDSGGRSSENGVANSQPGAAPDAELESFRAQVPRLIAARDKLLAELDEQNEETDRLAAENTALVQALASARKLCGAWENQASDSLVQIDRLKDLLEESALWPSPSKGGSGPSVSTAGSAGKENGLLDGTTATPPGPGVEDVTAAMQQLERQLVEARAKAAAADLQLRALVAEVSRVRGVTDDVRNATLPALSAIERGLQQLLKLTVTRVAPSSK